MTMMQQQTKEQKPYKMLIVMSICVEFYFVNSVSMMHTDETLSRMFTFWSNDEQNKNTTEQNRKEVFMRPCLVHHSCLAERNGNGERRRRREKKLSRICSYFHNLVVATIIKVTNTNECHRYSSLPRRFINEISGRTREAERERAEETRTHSKRTQQVRTPNKTWVNLGIFLLLRF